MLRLAGLDLSAYRSGKTSETAEPVISKQGKAELRYRVIQAAQVASALDANIRRYYPRWHRGCPSAIPRSSPHASEPRACPCLWGAPSKLTP